jgi:hypothetical protein
MTAIELGRPTLRSPMSRLKYRLLSADVSANVLNLQNGVWGLQDPVPHPA